MRGKRPEALAQKRFREASPALAHLQLDGVFRRIYETNLWGSDESRSGLGSEAAGTAALREAIAGWLRHAQARSLLDVPCGDFGWLSRADLAGIEYTGADIVEALVESNRQKYASGAFRFLHLDLTRDSLPRADVVLCRDCLVHLSFANVHRALGAIARSGSEFLLTTTFIEWDGNEDIQDGDWRPLNLELPPFSFPKPSEVLMEGCTECDGAYRDKALGVWRVSELPVIPESIYAKA